MVFPVPSLPRPYGQRILMMVVSQSGIGTCARNWSVLIESRTAPVSDSRVVVTTPFEKTSWSRLSHQENMSRNTSVTLRIGATTATGTIARAA